MRARLSRAHLKLLRARAHSEQKKMSKRVAALLGLEERPVKRFDEGLTRRRTFVHNLERLRVLLSQVDLVIVITTGAEVDALTRRLQPPSGRESIVETILGWTTCLIGEFGRYTTIVTQQCDPGSGGRHGTVETLRQVLNNKYVKGSPKVLLLGTAQGLQPKFMRLGDVIVSQGIGILRPDKTREYNEVLERTLSKLPEFSSFFKAMPGQLASGDVEYTADEILRFYPNAFGFESQGVGGADVANSTGSEWLIIKGIRNFAQQKVLNNDKLLADEKLAAENAAAVALLIFQ
jgi:hypothetical protein